MGIRVGRKLIFSVGLFNPYFEKDKSNYYLAVISAGYNSSLVIIEFRFANAVGEILEAQYIFYKT